MFLGECPYCKDGMVEIRKRDVRGKKVELYACCNAHWSSEDGEFYELTEESLCSFRIWQNALARYGKWFSKREIKELLKRGSLEVELVSKRYAKKITYKKRVVLSKEYGVCIEWE